MSQESKAIVHRMDPGVLVAVQSRLNPRQPIGATVSAVTDESIVLDLSMGSPGALFRVGEKVRLKYWDSEAIYFSDVEVLGTSGPDDQQLVIALPEQPVALQRRQSHRVPSDFSFTFTVVDAAHSKLISGKIHEARSDDVSAGGLRFTTDLPIRKGDELEVRLDVAPGESLVIAARAMAVEHVETPESGNNAVGVEFVRLETNDRNRIVQAVVEAYQEAEAGA